MNCAFRSSFRCIFIHICWCIWTKPKNINISMYFICHKTPPLPCKGRKAFCIYFFFFTGTFPLSMAYLFFHRHKFRFGGQDDPHNFSDNFFQVHLMRDFRKLSQVLFAASFFDFFTCPFFCTGKKHGVLAARILLYFLSFCSCANQHTSVQKKTLSVSWIAGMRIRILVCEN